MTAVRTTEPVAGTASALEEDIKMAMRDKTKQNKNAEKAYTDRKR